MSKIFHYAVAVATVGLALLITLELPLLRSRTPFALFFAAVLVATWYGGRYPGLLAIALAAFLCAYLVITPSVSSLPNGEGFFQITTFAIVAALINWLTVARNQSATQFAQSEGRLNTIVDSLIEGLVVSDMDGQVLHFNPSALEMHGFNSLEECQRSLAEFGKIFQLSTPDGGTLPINEWPLSRVLRGERLRNLEINIRRIETGETRTFDYAGVLVKNSFQQPLMAVVTMSDITTRKLAEDALLSSHFDLEQTLNELQTRTDELAGTTQQLLQASKLATMGELAASVAHEINNPLTTVSLHAEALLAQLPADDRKRRSVEIIDQEADRMAGIVRNLLEFSRRSHQQISSLDLREEVKTSVEFIGYYLRTRQIELAYDFALQLPTVHADRQQVRQLFLNLITNASDAMEGGGTIEVRAYLSELKSAPAVAVEFVDTGSGIAPDMLQKIWEPFYTTKVEGKGTGLGMAICRRIVEDNQGEITIESKVGFGTTVKVLFPVPRLNS